MLPRKLSCTIAGLRFIIIIMLACEFLLPSIRLLIATDISLVDARCCCLLLELRDRGVICRYMDEHRHVLVKKCWVTCIPFPCLQMRYSLLPFSVVWLAIEMFQSPRNGGIPPAILIVRELSISNKTSAFIIPKSLNWIYIDILDFPVHFHR